MRRCPRGSEGIFYGALTRYLSTRIEARRKKQKAMPGVTEHRFFQLLAPRFVTDSRGAVLVRRKPKLTLSACGGLLKPAQSSRFQTGSASPAQEPRRS